MELHPGVRVDRYVLVELLGEGNQGSVWKVVDPIDSTVKALKLFELSKLPHSAADRARREARSVKEVGAHPAIVPCRALFELPEGILGLVFDLVRGQALSSLMRDARMTRPHRFALLEQIAVALEHVHARGVVHRDLKPANILIADSFWSDPQALGGVKLVDFGISTPAGNPVGLTLAGSVVGTTAYLAPELLVRGRWVPSSDGYSRDVFAFGVLGWELLAGARPTGLAADAAPSAYVNMYCAADEGRFPWPPSLQIEEPLGAVMAACLALDPQRRPPTGAALVALMRPAASGSREERAPPPSNASATRTTDHAPRTYAHMPSDSYTGTPQPSERAPSARISSTGPFSAAPLVTPSPVSAAPSTRWAPDSASQNVGHRSHEEPKAAPDRPPARMGPWGIGAAVLLAALLASLFTHAIFGVGSQPAASTPVEPKLTTVAGNTAALPQNPAPIPCCGEGARCKSDRPCGTGACGGTIGNRWWQLRITGVAAGSGGSYPEDVSRSHPRARVCLWRSGATETEVCAPLAKTAATTRGDEIHRLRVHTSDLMLGRVEIRVEEDDGAILAQGSSASNPTSFELSALCKGVKLFVGPRERAPMVVYGYLDDG